MADDGNAELIRQAESIGLRLEYDNGLVVLRRSVPAARSEDAELQEALVIKQICNRIRGVHDEVVNAARLARKDDFIGRQVFIDFHLLGKLTRVHESGMVGISHSSTDRSGGTIEVDSTRSADDLLVIEIIRDREPDRSVLSPWISEENTRAGLERCENFGLRFKHCDGFNVVEWPADTTEGEERELSVRLLGRRMKAVFSLCLARARSMRLRDNFVGHRAFAPEFGTMSTVVSGDEDGSIILLSGSDDSTAPGATRLWRGQQLLVVADEPAQASADSKSEPARRRNWFRQALGAK